MSALRTALFRSRPQTTPLTSRAAFAPSANFSGTTFRRAASMSKDDTQESMDNTKADYVRLGSSGMKVSVPILGAMSFGSKEWMPWVVEEAEGLELLKAAYDRGLNTWDTANIYSNGVSEEIIGKALKKYSIPREKVFLLTKAWASVGEQPGSKTMGRPWIGKTKDYVNKGGLSRVALFHAVNDSLKRMDTEYIDLLQIHRFDPDTPIEETMKALHDLVQSGKVNYIGASSMWAYRFAMMQFVAEKNGWTKFVSMQNHYSLVYREEEREMNRFCKDTGVGLIPWGPLHAGMLARPIGDHKSTDRSKDKAEATPQEKEIVGRVEEIAKKHGWSMGNVSMAWMMHPRRGVSSPIVGFSSVKRIDEALEVKGKTLTDEEMDYLEEPYKPVEIQGHGN